MKLLGTIKHYGTNIVVLCHYKLNFTEEQSVLIPLIPRFSITNCNTIKQFYSVIKCRDNAVRININDSNKQSTVFSEYISY